MNKKILVTVVAAALLLCVAVGGTIAYLTASTTQVVNTFSPSSIGLTLTETDATDATKTTTANTYQMVPGATISKDPTVTVKGGSEKAYVFVKLEEVGITYGEEQTKAFTDYMTYSVQTTATADDTTVWTQLTNASGNAIAGVYYCVVEASENDQTFNVLNGDKVNVKADVTSEMMGYLATNNYPQLKITAYAIQYNNTNTTNFTPAEAWAAINK